MTFQGMIMTRADVLAYMRAQCPAQVTAINGLGVLTTNMPGDFVGYWGAPQVAQPETPALYVLPEAMGLRGTNWNSQIGQTNALMLVVEVGHHDEEMAMQWLLGYTQVVLNAIEQFILGLAPLAHSQQIGFGAASESPSGTQVMPVVDFIARGRAANGPFYVEANIPIWVTQDEAP